MERQELARYSSDLVKRGLALAQELQRHAVSSESNQVSKLRINSDIDSNEIKSVFSYGIENYQLGKNQAAIKCFSHVLRINPDHTDSLCFRGFARSSLDEQEANEDFTKVLNIAQQHNKSIHILYAEGIAQSLLGNSAEAIDNFTKALCTNPNYCSIFASTDLFLRGAIYYMFGNKKSASEDLNQALQINPSNVVALALKGSVSCELGEYQTAIEDLTLALEINTNHGQAALSFYSRGLAYYMLGEHQQAIEDLTQALRINPNHKHIETNFYLRGLANFQLNSHLKAIEDFEQVLKLNPNHDQSALIFYLTGLAYQQMQNGLKATENFTKALEINPNIHTELSSP